MSSALLVQQLIPQLAFLAPDRLLILLIIPALILAYIFASLRKNRRDKTSGIGFSDCQGQAFGL